ncbi:MAG: RNA polymerase sigma factor (sigma-70 family) [Hyphomicrobiaceae bacterium]|jgi:RNA polymerase sigma factor (sigma-70 family)
MPESSQPALDPDRLPIDGEQLERHLQPLQAYVKQRMGPRLAARESCDDVVQSVCRELLSAQARLHFPTAEALHGWLQTAAMRKILQKARHYRSQRRAVAREVADAHGSQIVARGDALTPSRDASAREQVARFESALAELPASDREVITMIKIAGLSHEEAAQRTGRTVVASRTMLRRALIRLSELLTEGDT